MVTSFGWRRSGNFQRSDCCSFYNVWEARGEGKMVGDTCMVTEEEGILFLVNVGGEQRLRVMPPTPAPPSSHKTRYPLSSVPKAGIVVCMVVVAVAVFLGASFLASC